MLLTIFFFFLILYHFTIKIGLINKVIRNLIVFLTIYLTLQHYSRKEAL